MLFKKSSSNLVIRLNHLRCELDSKTFLTHISAWYWWTENNSHYYSHHFPCFSWVHDRRIYRCRYLLCHLRVSHLTNHHQGNKAGKVLLPRLLQPQNQKNLPCPSACFIHCGKSCAKILRIWSALLHPKDLDCIYSFRSQLPSLGPRKRLFT